MGKKYLSPDQIEHIAVLAHIPLITTQLRIFSDQLGRIIEYTNKISLVENLPAGDQEKAGGDIFRSDKVIAKDCLTQDEATSGSKNILNGLFVVPTVLRQD